MAQRELSALLREKFSIMRKLIGGRIVDALQTSDKDLVSRGVLDDLMGEFCPPIIELRRWDPVPFYSQAGSAESAVQVAKDLLKTFEEVAARKWEETRIL
jgi:hypothetical protein